MFNKFPKHIQALIKDTAKGSNDPNKQMEAVISFYPEWVSTTQIKGLLVGNL